MAEWINALVFGLFLITFTLGLSSIIMAFITEKGETALRSQVEYGFFGATGLVLSLIFVYAML